MDDFDIRLGQAVRYVGKDKFGLDNEHTGQIFTVVSRSWDKGSNEYIYNLRNSWNEERFNVPAKCLKVV